MQTIKIWDPAVRVFHWSLVILFTVDAFFNDPEHLPHHWIGYIIAALVAGRILWGFVGSRYARFSSFPPSASASLGQLTDMATGRRKPHAGHSPLGGLMIYNLIVTIAVISVSGWLMTTDAYWGVEWPEELHEASVLWAEISIALHIAAVVVETIRTRVNLPRAMITGYKTLPVPQDHP